MTLDAGERVSVALCTHNGALFIAEQVSSILAQSVLPAEIVLSDDASTDDTVAIVESLLSEHPEVRLLVLRNPVALGVTANFAQAIAACRGEIVMLSDQDDVWVPTRVERTLEAFGSGDSVSLVHSDARLVDANLNDLGITLYETYRVDSAARAAISAGHGFEIFLRRNLVTGATAAIRSELAELAMPFPASWVHDEWLAVVAAATGRIVPLEDKLVDYRQHGGNEIGAVKVGLAAKLRRLTAPGAERNRRLLQRAIDLAERYPSLPGATTDRIRAVQGQVEHERARSALSVHRLARIAPVVREARTRRYSQFGGGLQDIVRDLVQPLRPGR